MPLNARPRLAILFLAAIAFPSGGHAQERTPRFVTRDLRLDVSLDFEDRSLSAVASLDVENVGSTPSATVSFLLGRLLEVSAVTDSAGGPLGFQQDVVRLTGQPLRQVTLVSVALGATVAPASRTRIALHYAGNVVGYQEVGWLYVRDRIDTAFTILRAEALAFPEPGGIDSRENAQLPSVPFTYDVTVTVPEGFVVATGGRLARRPVDGGRNAWRFRSEGASPFLNVAVARFDAWSTRGVNLAYFREDSAGARRIMRGTRLALDTLEAWFGPRRGPTELRITEIPDGWGSQADLVGGIILSAAAFRDSRRIYELYHELTHLWNVPDLEQPSPRWDEGLATFLEDLLLERVDGWEGRARSEQRILDFLKERVSADSTLRRIPFRDYGRHRMTDLSYSVGAVMFSILHRLVGDERFNALLRDYAREAANGGTSTDLARVARRHAGEPGAALLEEWLFTTRWTARVAAADSVGELVRVYRATPRR